MNMQLKQAVREHIENIALNENQLKWLESMIRTMKDNMPRRTPARFLPWIVAGALAAFILAFVLTPVFVGEVKDMPRLIAEEVAKNHIKLKPLEVTTGNIQGVRDYFKKLDFVPVESKLFKQSGLELLGGRYCSIQGVTAAQLRVSAPGSNKVQALYQVEYKKDIFKDLPQIDQGEKPISVYAKGIKVKIWVEKDLLFALTEDVTSTENN